MVITVSDSSRQSSATIITGMLYYKSFDILHKVADARGVQQTLHQDKEGGIMGVFNF